MNAPNQEDVPSDLIDQLDAEWTFDSDMKRMEIWHDEFGHVVVSDNGDQLAVTPWFDHDSGGSEKAAETVYVEEQPDAATRAAECALDLEREGIDGETSVFARVPVLQRLFQ